jgi:hypothetical protein
MSTLTSDDPATREALGVLHYALARLDPALRADLRRVVADPGIVGAAGLTVGVYVTHPEQPDRRCACPVTAMLLLRGETSWEDLARCQRAGSFDVLHETPSWSKADVNDLLNLICALDLVAEAAGWAVSDHGPRNPRRAAAVLRVLLGRMLDQLAATSTCQATPARAGAGRGAAGGWAS